MKAFKECTKYQKHVNNLGKLNNSVHNQRCDCGASRDKRLDSNQKDKGGILYLKKKEKEKRQNGRKKLAQKVEKR